MIKNKILKTQLVDWRKLEWLQPKNFKDAKPEIIDKLKTSLKNNGFASPFHVWKNKTKIYICDGSYRHMVLNEMLKEGIKIPDKLPANFIDCKNKTEAKKMVLVYNSHYATVNEDGMADFLDGMNIDELDLEINIPDIDLLNLGDDDVIEDEPPPVPDKPKSKLGDIYELGKHRVICGDSTREEIYKILMKRCKANLLMTSPPYWLGKDYEKEKSEEEVNKFISDSVKCFDYAMKKDFSRIVINTGSSMATKLNEKNARTILLIDKWTNSLLKLDWYLRHIRIWDKSSGSSHGGGPVSAKSDIVYNGHEFILTFYLVGSKSRGQNKISEPWAQQSKWDNITGQKQENLAGFPIELPIRNIKLYSLKNEIVLDPYLGNGSTLIACEQTDRICYGIELEPCYIDVIVQRYVNYTGNEKIRKNGKSIVWKQNKSDGDK